MSTGLDAKHVRDTYAQLSDRELTTLVEENGKGLTAEALEIAKDELRKRGLGPRLSTLLEAQNKDYTAQELSKYYRLISELNCPGCGSNNSPLNATQTMEVMSFLIFTHTKKQVRIGCPDCLDKLNNKALTKSLLLGWWGFPWGIIKTVQAIMTNAMHKRTNHADQPTETLQKFTAENIGLLEIHKNDVKARELMIAGA